MRLSSPASTISPNGTALGRWPARVRSIFNRFACTMTPMACGWRKTPVKSSALRGVGPAAIYGFSPSYLGQQGRGIGQELLKRTLDHAEKSGAAHKALITFTFNTVSQGLYIRHGLYPRFPIYNFGVARESLMGRLRSAQLRCVPLANVASHLQSLAEVDARALGVSREKHHRYLIDDGGTRGFLLCAGDDRVGYVYVTADGVIGPLAVAEAHDLGAAFTTALALAAENGSPQVSAFIPGTCDSALSLAVEHGMRITLPMVLMATRDFDGWTRYLPRNAGFM